MKTAKTMKSGSQSETVLEIVDGKKLVKKISKTTDYVIELEGDILTRINQLNCSNVCELIKRESGQLFLEFIEGKPLTSYRGKAECAISLINRGLVTAAILNEELEIVHNDLHGENVLVRSVSKDYAAYVFEDGQELVYETFGLEPVLIDFGLAFPGKCSDRMRTTTAFTELGLFPFETDRLADARRLVKEIDVTSGKAYQEFSINRAESFGKMSTKLRQDSGWFHPYFENMSEVISEALRTNVRKDDALYPSVYFIDLFSAQLPLPLVAPTRTVDPILAYENFRNAFFETGAKKLTGFKIMKFVKDSFDLDEKTFHSKYEHCFREDLNGLRRAGRDLVSAIQKIAFETAEIMSARKKKLNALSPCSSIRQVVSRLTTPVSFDEGTRLGVYSVKNRKNFVVEITKELANALNSKTVTISQLID